MLALWVPWHLPLGIKGGLGHAWVDSRTQNCTQTGRPDDQAQHLQPVSMGIVVQDIYSEERGGQLHPKV